MASKQQIARLAQRIEAMAAAKQGKSAAWVWRYSSETQDEALARHYAIVAAKCSITISGVAVAAGASR